MVIGIHHPSSCNCDDYGMPVPVLLDQMTIGNIIVFGEPPEDVSGLNGVRFVVPLDGGAE